MPIRVIVLAAGKGTRMKSSLPKVLHPLADRPMLQHVLDTAAAVQPAGITVVVGHGSADVRERIEQPVSWAEQREQLGTGHAVAQALDGITDEDRVLITYGDVPLIQANTLQALLGAPGELALLTLVVDDATGYGRIVRDQNQRVTGIVEQKDATPEQLAIGEYNAGVIAVDGRWLRPFIAALDNDNAQGEYYLTDLAGMAYREGLTIATVHPGFAWEADGINSRAQLARLERIFQAQKAQALMDAGVTLRDPARIDIRGTVQASQDCLIDVNCVFEGHCTLGEGVTIGANCHLINATIGDGAVIKANSIIERSKIGEACQVGPFARVRPGTSLARGAFIGNFVETKNARIGEGTKISHLSYVGDAELGHKTNIGAGTITANYDGANKHRTVMGDDVSIGSNTTIVAPATIENGSTVGAGSVITQTVAAGTLVVARGRQTAIENWQRPVKKP